MFEEIKDIKSGKKELREFGLTIGIILVILGALALWRGKPVSAYFLIGGAAFITLGLLLPRPLKPLQKAWMGFSVVIGFFVSRIILFVLFYAVLTPIGLIARLVGKDVLDQRLDRKSASYWREKEPAVKTKESYENQY